jgi:hypothetical protein
LADINNYQAYRTEENSDQIAIVHNSPSASDPENIATVEEASKRLRQSSLWTWATKFFDDKVLGDTFTVSSAITFAKETDADNLFEISNDENDEHLLSMRRGAVSATAAIALNLRDVSTQEDLDWARDVLRRAICLQEIPDPMWSSGSIIPWHQGIYVARGLAADLREGTAECDAAMDLLKLIAHPLEVVSFAAIEEACKLWPKDPKLTWAALLMAFSLCHVPRRPRGQRHQHSETLHSSSETQAAFNIAAAYYQDGSGWPPLPLPPPAWVKIQSVADPRGRQSYEEFDSDEVVDTTETWGEPDVFWYSKHAAEILQRIPFDDVLNSSARDALLNFLYCVLDWTIQKNAPPWIKPSRRNRSESRMYEWNRMLGSKLGHVAGLLPLADFQERFLAPILGLEDEDCWALLSPLAHTYVCAYVYDAPVVPPDAITLLDLCLNRLLKDTAFKRDAYHSGKLSGFDLPELVNTLMFVSVERADMAARYVNGDWSEIGRIMPLVDRFIRAGGWAASVVDPYLTLCERSKTNYPAESFANQILEIIGNGIDNLKGWHGTFIPARIAELVHHLAHRDTPMQLTLAQQFLQILDVLVDMGDRRSAALQLSEEFREIRLPT